MTSLLESFIPSGLRITERLPFKPLSDTFEGEQNSILYDNEKRLIELLLKNSEEAVSVIEVEIQEEIKGCNSTKKKDKKYRE